MHVELQFARCAEYSHGRAPLRSSISKATDQAAQDNHGYSYCMMLSRGTVHLMLRSWHLTASSTRGEPPSSTEYHACAC